MSARKHFSLLILSIAMFLFASGMFGFLRAQETDSADATILANLDSVADAPVLADAAPAMAEEATNVTEEVDTDTVEGTVPETDPNEAEKILGYVYTADEDNGRYVPYTGIHGSLLQDDKAVAEFTTDENGAFMLFGVQAGDYTVMAENETDDTFGSRDITIVYDQKNEDHVILFLNKCGLARFPADFDPEVPIAENKVKYWDYVKCGGDQKQVVKEETVEKTYTQTQPPYPDPYAQNGAYSSGMGSGWGALGLLGLLGLIGISGDQPGPISGF